MANTNIFSDDFYHSREEAVRQQIGNQLNRLKKDISQLYSPCTVRMMKIKKEMTLKELLSLDPNIRQAIIAAILYNDALWRIESAYIMLCIGMLNIAYSNLRSCLESIVSAHIVENLDSEAVNFLKTGKINPTKISSFIPEEYNNNILHMKNTLSNWGVHSNLRSVQLSVLFGPNTFDKMISHTTTLHNQALNEAFLDAAENCINVIGDVFVIFMWFINKGTKYQRTI